MNIVVEITRDAVVATGMAPLAVGCGAVAEFAGVVRGDEDGATIPALDYEAYEVMAQSEIVRILQELAVEYPCESVAVRHRIGRVAVGEISILVRIESRHRAEAFGMLAKFMDRLKREVPIWKRVAS